MTQNQPGQGGHDKPGSDKPGSDRPGQGRPDQQPERSNPGGERSPGQGGDRDR